MTHHRAFPASPVASTRPCRPELSLLEVLFGGFYNEDSGMEGSLMRRYASIFLFFIDASGPVF